MVEIRPWGWFEDLHESQNGYKVKRLFVKANQRISLQYHLKRNEHWIVVEGDGFVTICGDEKKVKVGDYVFIPKKANHRIRAGKGGIMIIEVQQGTLCVETDIVRLEDDYSRI